MLGLYVERFVDTSKNTFCLKYCIRNKTGTILNDEANHISLKNANLEQKICRLAMMRCLTAALPWPGFEPGLSRPQREVLTTIRSRLTRRLENVGLNHKDRVKLKNHIGLILSKNATIVGKICIVKLNRPTCSHFMQTLWQAKTCFDIE